MENPLISGYGIEKNVKWSTLFCKLAKIQKTLEKENKPMVIFDTMSIKVEKLLLELSEEVLRVRPKTKK